PTASAATSIDVTPAAGPFEDAKGSGAKARGSRACIACLAIVAAEKPKIVAVAGEDPFHRSTWSGASYWLVRALQDEDALEGAVAAGPRMADFLERTSAFSWDTARWRQRYWAHATPASGLTRTIVAVTGAARVRRVTASPDVLLQLGAWFEPVRWLRPRARCSYSDMHLALFLTRPDNRLDRTSRLVRKALERERRTFDALDRIFTMSDWLRASIVADAGQDPQKVVTVWNGANVALPPVAPVRQLEPPRFLFVGRRFERKGGRFLLDAFQHVNGERPDAELWIVGPTAALREQEGVRWFGHIDRSTPAGDRELGRLYTEATAFVMPSLFEPLGSVFFEAMAHALPCIGTDCCAMPEFVVHGENGLLARPADVHDLAARMLELASDPPRAREMGMDGFRRVRERFTWSGVARRIVEHVARAS
ncbi:MAG: glycosyltransferase family 4 protein, partial [Actinomycetota bacterium]|nr:glycosyltransferase family 4 protein [Actinomycetota bacterium]